MKKSNWIVYIIALLISAFLLWLWFFLEFDHIDAPLDLVLSIIWWVLIALACFGIHRVEQKRRERLRTCYLRDGMLYNSEAGTMALPTPQADDAVEAMRNVLGKLDYGFDIQDRPEDENGNPLRFTHVVRSKKFKEHESDSERDANGASGTGSNGDAHPSDDSVDWEGEVVLTARPGSDPIPFESADELRAILQNTQ